MSLLVIVAIGLLSNQISDLPNMTSIYKRAITARRTAGTAIAWSATVSAIFTASSAAIRHTALSREAMRLGLALACSYLTAPLLAFERRLR